jgi:hypothetical protein
MVIFELVGDFTIGTPGSGAKTAKSEEGAAPEKSAKSAGKVVKKVVVDKKDKEK